MGDSFYHGFLERAQIKTQIREYPFEVKYGIHDELSWTMKRDVTAAIDLNRLGPESTQQSFIREQVLRIGALSQRINRWVLDAEYHVW
jgi:hypothetical protein